MGRPLVERAPPPPTTSALSRWPLGAALFFVGLFSFARVSDMDAGWLLSLGREVAQGRFPSTNAISWTSPDTPWYPTNWLFDLLLYGAHEALGVFGVQIVVFALGAGALGVAHRAAVRAGASVSAADAAALLAVGVFWTRLSPRPHLVEYLLEAVVLERCVAARSARRWRPLSALPLLIGLWMNAHQSAPFGLAVAGLALVDVVVGRAGWAPSERRRLLGVFGVSALALLATPGLEANLRDLVAHLSINTILPVMEHQRPVLSEQPYLFVAVALVLAAAWVARAQWPLVLPAALFAAMTVGLGRRFVGDLAIAGIVPVSLAMAELQRRFALRRAEWLGLGGLVGTLGFFLGSNVPVTMLGAFVGPEWEPSALPVEALRAARAAGVGPRGYQDYRFGGYVGFVAPELKAFQDGRIRAWPASFWREEVEALRSKEAFSAWLDRWGVTWALVASEPASLSGHGLLDSQPGWRRLHADDTAQVWVREAPAGAPAPAR